MRYSALLAAAAALAGATAVAAPAAAADGKQTRTEVTYTDLDLSTEAGRAELAQRFDNAAKQMCGFEDGATESRTAKACYKRNSNLVERQVASAAARQQANGG